MDFNDIVGFLITVAAIFYMFIKRSQDSHKGHAGQIEDEGEQSEILKDFLTSLKEDMEHSEDFKSAPQYKKAAPILPALTSKTKISHSKHPPVEEFKFKSDLDDFQMQTNIEGRKLKINVKNRFEGDYGDHLISPEFRGEKIPELFGRNKPSRIRNLIYALPNKKDLILLNEVLNPPKGL